MARRRGLPLPLLMLLVIGLPTAAAITWMIAGGAGAEGDTPLSDPIQRGPMRVSVIESGSLEALKSHTIRSKVEGRAEIIFLISEGTVLTAADVEAGKVLVRLDDSGLKEKIDKQNIDIAAAQNGHENALANLAIQQQQNASDNRKAALDVRFAFLDLERYIGQALSMTLRARHEAAAERMAGEGDAPLVRFIASLFANDELQGEAVQKRRELKTNIQLAIEELNRADVKFKWSTKLEAKGYASKEELVADRLALERRKIELERAETAREQFERYDFPKQVERLLSDLVDARDRRLRVKAKGNSAEGKNLSDVETRARQLDLRRRKLDKYNQQLGACVIRAEKPGLVVYASSGKDRGWRDNDIIAEGTSVRQRQEIIRIPQPGSLGAKVNVHESVIDKIVPGLACKIVVDAIPGHEIEGVLVSRSPLPNSVNRWINPDLKVYSTVIDLVDEDRNLKPGMSCSAEIVLGELKDVLAVPVQAVGGSVERPAIWIWRGDHAVRSAVVLGPSNDRYVQIISGLSVGDRVVLAPPREGQRDAKKRAQAPNGESGKKRGGKPGGARGKKPATSRKGTPGSDGPKQG